MRRFLVILALTLAFASPGLATSTQTILVAAADDWVLASMFLVAEEPGRHVVLFDPTDPGALVRYRSELQLPASCFYRDRTPIVVRDAMEAASGSACQQTDDLAALARRLWPAAKALVLVDDGDYEWLLRGAAYAGVTGAALLPLSEDGSLSEKDFEGWNIETIYALPGSIEGPPIAAVAERLLVIDTPAQLRRRWFEAAGDTRPSAVVVTNPRDRLGVFSPSWLSLLAPRIAALHRAPLILAASARSGEIEEQVHGFVDRYDLPITHVILVGDELAIRSHRVQDPVLAAGGPLAIGGGTEIRVELFSEIQSDRPQDFAVGRIVAETVAQASIVLARQLSAEHAPVQRVAVLSNADDVFALGETISRTTVSELRNRGVPTRAFFRDAVTPERIREELLKADILAWEGHARDLTLEERGGVGIERAPRLTILQGCYTLDRSDPFILMERGTEAIVATSAAIYSASGSAFARALFDNLLYEDSDLGNAVRNARNYLFALSRLQRLRGHAEWQKTYRAALAFALWGDPTQRFELPLKKPKVRPIGWSAHEGRLELQLPAGRLPQSQAGRYNTRPVPRAMMGGLIVHRAGEKARRLQQLYFTTQVVSAPFTACALNIAWDVVSLYAPRTQTLSVLVRPDWYRLPAAGRRGTFSFPLVTEGADCRLVEIEGPPYPSG